MCKNIPNCKTGVFLKIKKRLSLNVIFRHELHWLNKFNNTLLYSTYRFSLQCGFSRVKMMHKIGTCQSVGSSRSIFNKWSIKMYHVSWKHVKVVSLYALRPMEFATKSCYQPQKHLQFIILKKVISVISTKNATILV